MTELRRQRRHYRPRLTKFSAAPTSSWPGELLEGARLGDGPDVLYVVGPVFGVAELREIVAAELPEGWHAGANYLSLPNPVLRYWHDSGYRLELQRAAAWFGEGDYTAAEATAAWRLLEALVRGGFNEGRLLATAGSTGRYLALRSISGDRAWPVLSEETQSFLRATSGQGRVQVFPRSGIAPLVQYDGRLAYGAQCSRLPAGEPIRDELDRFEGWHVEARYRVRFGVPRRWERECECGAPGHAGIGLLPVRLEEGGTDYPAAPGQSAVTWAGNREVAVALRHGWRVQVLERLVYPTPPYTPANRANGQTSQAGPLDRFSAKLVGLRRTPRPGDRAAELVNAGLRALLLFGIGAMHGAPRKITRTVSAAEARAGAIPDTARDVLPLGSRFAWTEPEPVKWPEMSHPEWTTAIWSRARVALLDTPAGNGARAGALLVPAASVVAMLTDALYLSADPEWPDDGAVGRYRRVWRSDGPVELPRRLGELRRVKGSSS